MKKIIFITIFLNFSKSYSQSLFQKNQEITNNTLSWNLDQIRESLDDSDLVKTELDELNEMWLEKVYYLNSMGEYLFFRKKIDEPRKYKVFDILQTTNYDRRYSTIPNWFEYVLVFDSGDTLTLNKWKFKEILTHSESTEERAIRQKKRLEEVKTDYLNKDFSICWTKKIISGGKYYFITCTGIYQEEREILNMATNSNLIIRNGSKYSVIEITLDSEKERYYFKLIDDKGATVILNDDLYYLEVLSESQEHKKERLFKLSTLQSKYGARIAKIIMEGNVQIGMTKEMCRLSWGEPNRVNTTTTTYGKHEQWVYSDGRRYLYFEKGILTSIQN